MDLDRKEHVDKEQILKQYMRRTVKASVFEDLFSNKEYLLQLYQALHPEDTNVSEEDLEYVTLQQIMVNNPYNDLGFMVGTRLMILVEAQSTWTENIILRCIMYLTQTWKDYFAETKQSVYSSRKLEFPEPELYVIYTGEERIQKKYISFSEEFFEGRKTAVDATIKVLVDGRQGDILNQYVMFTKIVDRQRALYKDDTKKAIMETIRICKDRNVLKKYLESREKEVIDIMVTLYSQEEVTRDFVASERFHAKIENTVEMCKEFEKSFTETVRIVAKKFDFSDEKAQHEVSLYWDEQDGKAVKQQDEN
ncbi:MAG: hypothetical protein HFH41_06625 [Lachnospiraceae bacterium]|nr:hypothetical protein [Lachnospiraceae bacterium]